MYDINIIHENVRSELNLWKYNLWKLNLFSKRRVLIQLSIDSSRKNLYHTYLSLLASDFVVIEEQHATLLVNHKNVYTIIHISPSQYREFIFYAARYPF